jgi:predicted RNA binding protein YcfA (HicA-like mRNA interferase family)
MTKIPVLTARDVIRGLKKAGFLLYRQARGSHEIWYNPVTKRRTTIPNHPGVDIPKGTLKAVLKEADISLEKFLKLIE